MGKIEQMREAARIEAESKITTAAELAEVVGRMAVDMSSLIEETRQTMADGQRAAQRIEQSARSLDAMSEFLKSWTPPPPLIHEAPVRPVLLAALMIGLTLGLSTLALVELRIAPRLERIEARIAQAEPRNASPPTTPPSSPHGASSMKR